MRSFVYKRSLNDLHQNIAARVNSISVPTVINTPASSSDPVKTPDPVTPATSAAQPSTSPAAVAPTSSPPTSSSSTSAAVASPATSTPSSSLVSSPSSTASSSSASSPAVASPSPSTPSNVVPSSYNPNPVSVHVVTGTSFSSSPSSTVSASPSNDSTSGTTHTGAIIGGVAGTIGGIIVLGLLIMWCMRRQRNRDMDDFDAQAFKRQSAILVDDPVEPPQSFNRRPPTMVERYNASPALAAQADYGGQNFYGNYNGFGQQSPYPNMAQQSASPPQQAFPPAGYAAYEDPRQQIIRQPSNVGFALQQPVVRQPSNVGYGDHAPQQQLARQPSNGNYLTRQPSAPVGYAPPAPPPNALDSHYIDLNRSSVSPYQAAQYADISRHLGTSNPNTQVAQPTEELLDEPLPSPFDDPVEPNPPAPPPHGNAPRPDTLYDVGDAYSGI